MKFVVIKWRVWEGKPEEVKEFPTYVSALRYCSQKNWQIVDEKGFIWDLEIKEKD